jgi:hypothetical protein
MGITFWADPPLFFKFCPCFYSDLLKLIKIIGYFTVMSHPIISEISQTFTRDFFTIGTSDFSGLEFLTDAYLTIPTPEIQTTIYQTAITFYISYGEVFSCSL